MLGKFLSIIIYFLINMKVKIMLHNCHSNIGPVQSILLAFFKVFKRKNS